MKISQLSKRRQKLMRYIIKRCDACYPPTYREMCLHMDIKSPNGINGHLKALEAMGYIDRLPGISRGITLSEKFKKRGLPLLDVDLQP